MAILKNVECLNGVICSYHKIGITYINWHDRNARLDVLMFLDEDARTGGKIPVATRRYDILPEEFPYDPTRNIVADSYTYIKTLPEFEGAVDDL